MVHIIAAEQVIHGYFTNFHAAVRLRLIDVGEEGFFHLGHDFQMQIADGVETAPHQHDGALVQHIRRLGHLAVRQEQGGRRQAGLDELEREKTVVHHGKTVAFKTDDIYFHQPGIQIVHQGFNEFLQTVPFEKDGVQDVDAQDAQVLHLAVVVRVVQANVNNQVGRFCLRFQLEAHPYPAMPGAVVPVAFDFYRIAEGKEAGVFATLGAQAVDELGKFVVQHAFQSFFRNVALDRPVQGVADGHVISGNGFGHCSGGSGCPEKPVGRFLSGSDFRKGAVNGGSQVELEGFVLCLR